MEKDDDWYGAGNEYTTEFRQLDVRTGRWMSMDPMMAIIPDRSPYEFAFNNPIAFVDPSGLLPSGKGGGDPNKNQKGPGQHKQAKDPPKGKGSGGKGTEKGDSGGGGGGSPASSIDWGATFDKVSEVATKVASKTSVVIEKSQQKLKEIAEAGDEWTYGGGGQEFGKMIYSYSGAGAYADFVWGIFTGESTLGKEMSAGEIITNGLTLVPTERVLNLVVTEAGIVYRLVAAKGGKMLWKLTDEGASAIKLHSEFGKIFKSKSDGLWWAVDNAGHGGSKFKVFKEGNKGLEWINDADEFGDFILNKHKGSIGKFIPWGKLKTIK